VEIATPVVRYLSSHQPPVSLPSTPTYLKNQPFENPFSPIKGFASNLSASGARERSTLAAQAISLFNVNYKWNDKWKYSNRTDFHLV
jgi:hypothetical protein